MEDGGKRVLVVDDSAVNVKILSALLSRSGYTVVTASSADEARRQFEASAPQVVLTDLHLGAGADGVALAESLRRLAAPPVRVRIALMTADAGVTTREGLFDAVLEKPVAFETLRHFLEEKQ